MPSLLALRNRLRSWLRKAHSPRVQSEAVLTVERTEARRRLPLTLSRSRVLRGCGATIGALFVGVLFVVAPPLGFGSLSGSTAFAVTLPVESSTPLPSTGSPSESSSPSSSPSSPDPSGSGSPSAEESSTPSPSATPLVESGHVWTDDEVNALMVTLVVLAMFVPFSAVMLLRLR